MKKGIKSWDISDRPREKLLTKGAIHLSNSELLAILINSGTKTASALDLAKTLLEKNQQDLNVLGKLSVQELLALKIKGIGKARAVAIIAALELGNRRLAAVHKQIKIKNSTDIALFLQSLFQHYHKEVFIVVYLNKANIITHYEMMSEGGISGTVVDVKLIIQAALLQKSAAIILSHNHPSGSLEPSKQDIEITKKIAAAASFFDIKVMDHIIVSTSGYYSFADSGVSF